jgi:hypothetical protein
LVLFTLGYHSSKLNFSDIFELGFWATARQELTLFASYLDLALGNSMSWADPSQHAGEERR